MVRLERHFPRGFSSVPEEDSELGNDSALGMGGRKRVLLLAYACSPYGGSEVAVGWNRAMQTREYFDTWVICGRREFEADIKRFVRQNGQIPGIHFYFLSRTRFEKWLWKLPMGFYAGYRSWQKRAYRLAVHLHAKYHFDIVHQVTWTGFREPGYLWKFDVPFVWGPVGGTQNLPWRFLPRCGLIGALKEGSRTIVNRLQLRFSSRVRQAAKKAQALLTGNSTGLRDFRDAHNANPVLLLETGVRTTKEKTSINLEGVLKILWSGEFKHHKALHLLLHALSRLAHNYQYELQILGRGPLEKEWRTLSKRLGIEARCKWIGWLPYEEALQRYARADVLVFTSLRDTSGNVVLEALSCGTPVICFDHQGVGDIVTPYCGIKVAIATPQQAIADLSVAIRALIHDRIRLRELSRGATERAKDFLWSSNGAQVAAIYDQILADRHNANGDAKCGAL